MGDWSFYTIQQAGQASYYKDAIFNAFESVSHL